MPGPQIDARAGFLPQAYDAILAERLARLREADMLGEGFDLDSPGEPIPALVRVGAEREALVQLRLSEVAGGLRRDVAGGALLDAGVSLAGLERLSAKPSTVAGVIRGAAGAAAGGRLFRFRRTGTLWRAPEGATVGGDGTLSTLLECTEDGPVPAYASGTEEWEKASAAPLLASFEATAGAQLGRYEETDPELRERARIGPAQAGTEPAYYRRLYEVAGAGRVVVFNNRTNAIDAKGVKAKHVECLVSGGSDEAVALAIFRAACADSGLQGNTRVTPLALDEDGVPYPRQPTIYFSREERRRAYVRVALDVAGTEVALPSGYAGIVRSAIAARAALLVAGRDLLRGPFEARVVSALPDGSVSQAVVSFRWGPGDAWSSPLLAVDARVLAEVFAGPAPAVLECAPGPYLVSPGWHLDLSSGAGLPQAVDLPEGAQTAGALASALTAAAVPGLSFGQRGGRLTMRTDDLGEAASLNVDAGSSAGLLLVLGIVAGPVLGSASDVTVTP